VQQVNGADLRFGNAVGPAKIEFDGRSFAFAVLHAKEDRIDFLLRKLTVQVLRSWAYYRLDCGKL
jgi:hypothetical protein